MNNAQPNSQPSKEKQLSTKFIGQTYRKKTNDSFGETIEQFSFSPNGSGEFYVAWTVGSNFYELDGQLTWNFIEDKIQVNYTYIDSDGVSSREKELLVYDEQRNIMLDDNDNKKVFKSIASNNSRNVQLNEETSTTNSKSSTDFFEKLQLKKLQNSKSADDFGDDLGLIVFSLPKNIFNLSANYVLKSNELNSTIKVFFSETSQMDSPDAIWEKSDLSKAIKQGIDVTYFAEKKDWAVVSGFSKSGNIIYRKGFFFKPENNYAGENGKNTQPWCQTVVIELEYPKNQKESFDKIIGDLFKSLKIDFNAINSGY
jgi:hypothetical protein